MTLPCDGTAPLFGGGVLLGSRTPAVLAPREANPLHSTVGGLSAVCRIQPDSRRPRTSGCWHQRSARQLLRDTFGTLLPKPAGTVSVVQPLPRQIVRRGETAVASADFRNHFVDCSAVLCQFIHCRLDCPPCGHRPALNQAAQAFPHQSRYRRIQLRCPNARHPMGGFIHGHGDVLHKHSPTVSGLHTVQRKQRTLPASRVRHCLNFVGFGSE